MLSFKVVRVVKLKLAFMELLFYNLVILIKLHKIRYLNLNKVLLFLRNQAICLKNWKFDELQLPQSLIFFAEILRTFPT